MPSILYNVTIKIDHSVHDAWRSWMIDKHIPDVMATNCFSEYKLSRIMHDESPEDGQTYAIQYLAKSAGHLQAYQEDHAPTLQAEHTAKFKGMFGAFRTLLEVIDQSP